MYICVLNHFHHRADMEYLLHWYSFLFNLLGRVTSFREDSTVLIVTRCKNLLAIGFAGKSSVSGLYQERLKYILADIDMFADII